MSGIARLLVGLSSLLVPRARRRAWREEWLNELQARSAGHRRRRLMDQVRCAAGAPVDAWAVRRLGDRRASSERHFGWHGWRTDVAQTLRLVGRSPLACVATVFSLSVGLTASVSVYSGLNSLVWGEMPGIADRASLADLHLGMEFGRAGTLYAAMLTESQYDRLRAAPPAVAGIGAEGTLPLVARVGDDIADVLGAAVSGNYFEVLGTRSAAGRLLTRLDEAAATPVVVISHRFWRDRLGQADITGRTLVLGAVPMHIVGVAPADFDGLRMADVERGRAGIDVWLPLTVARRLPSVPAKPQPWLMPVIRLAPLMTRQAAELQFASLAGALAETGPPQFADRRRTIRLSGFRQPRDGSMVDLMGAIAAFLAAPLIVLGIACANAANLRLSRAAERAREIAVRLSLGASRWQVIRLLAIEIVLVAAAAMFFAWIGTTVVIAQTARLVPFAVRPDWRVVVFAAGLTVMVVALSGLAPAWLATRRVRAGTLRQMSLVGGPGHARLRHALVGSQVALSLFLLIAGALFSRSAAAVAARTPDVAAQLVAGEIDLGSAGHDAASAAVFAERLLDRLGREPQVRHAALSDAGLLPRNGTSYRGLAPDATWQRALASRRVTPGWFDVMDARLIAGRPLDARDRAPNVAVVNETLAGTIAPGGSAVGMTLLIPGQSRDAPRPIEIIGVVRDVALQPGTTTPDAALYLPLAGDVPLTLTLAVRTPDPAALVPVLRRRVADLDSRAPWTQIETAGSILARDMAWTSILAWAIGALGVLALVLAMGGLYAVLACLVALRTREIGIRLAVGARPAQIVRLIFRQALRVVAIGAGAGLLLAIPAAFVLRALIVGVSPLDAVSILPMVALTIAVAAAASLVPARRAARIDPNVALRDL